MKKNDGFLSGLMVGYLLTKKKAEPEKKSGCLDSLLGFVIFGVAVLIGMNFGAGGLVFAAILCFVVIPLSIYYIKSQRIKKLKINQEVFDLYNDEKYTLALEKALSITEKSPDIAYLIGLSFFNGLGCDLDYTKAFEYFKIGSTGNINAKAMYAYMLIEGIGFEQNIDLGKSLLLEASSKNNTLATLKVGEYQLNGAFTFEKDVQSAMKMLRKAMDEGLPYAKYLVGVILLEGKEGVTQNKEQGLHLLKEAADAGINQAIDYLKNV